MRGCQVFQQHTDLPVSGEPPTPFNGSDGYASNVRALVLNPRLAFEAIQRRRPLVRKSLQSMEPGKGGEAVAACVVGGRCRNATSIGVE